MSYLNSQEIDEIKKGAFQLECVEMSIKSGDGEVEFRGAGRIEQLTDGRIEAVLYDSEYETPTTGVDPDLRVPAGDWIPRSDLFDLEAVDLKGRSWKSTNLRPDTSYHWGRPGAIIRAYLFEVSSEDPPARDGKDSLSLHIPGVDRIPVNKGTEVTIKSPRGESRGMTLDFWMVEDNDYLILIQKEETGIDVTVRFLKGPPPPGFDTRLEEALWFVLHREVSWDLLQSRIGQERRVAIRVRDPVRRPPRVQPPLVLRSSEAPGSLGEVLLKLLKHLSTYGEPRYHPLSVLVKKVLQGSSSDVHEEALALGVAVEGVVRQEFAGWLTAGKGEIETVEKLEAYLDSWDGTEDWKRRAKGCVSSMKGRSPRTALRMLAEEGVILPKHRTAWEKIRHVSAHGEEYSGTVRELVSHADTTHQLFLALILHTIGYAGPIVDRTTLGWPTVDFPFSGTGSSQEA